MTKKYTKYTKEILEAAVKNSVSFAGIFRYLNKRASGGQQQNLKKWIQYYQINISHFLPKRSEKKTWQKVLVLNKNSQRRERAWLLRRALIESGRSYCCEECEQGTIWQGKKLMLQIEHKNRNWKDNRPENLQFLCPNCHSITEGWCGSRGLSDIMTVYRQTKDWRKRRGICH